MRIGWLPCLLGCLDVEEPLGTETVAAVCLEREEPSLTLLDCLPFAIVVFVEEGGNSLDVRGCGERVVNSNVESGGVASTEVMLFFQSRGAC